MTLQHILKTIWYINTILWDYESVWPDVWPQNKCRSLWLIFHGPVIFPYILKTDIWTPYFGIVSQYHPMFDLKINIGHCDLYFIVHWFCLISLYLMDECHTFGKWVSVIRSSDLSFLIFALKNILVLLAKHDSGELRCTATALFHFWCQYHHTKLPRGSKHWKWYFT